MGLAPVGVEERVLRLVQFGATQQDRSGELQEQGGNGARTTKTR